MKYKVGQEFTLQTSLGPKQTHIVSIKYEFADYIKGGPKYVSEEDVAAYESIGVLTPSGSMSEKEIAIKELERKFNTKLAEIDENGKVVSK